MSKNIPCHEIKHIHCHEFYFTYCNTCTLIFGPEKETGRAHVKPHLNKTWVSHIS